MPERRVKVIYSAEIQNYKAAMEAAAAATEKTKKAAEDAGKASEEAGKASEESGKATAEAAALSAAEIAKVAAAHQEAAKALDLQYSGTGQLVDMNGKALTSQQAAAVGLQTFSQEAYLAGRAAEEAGAAAEIAAQATAEAAKAAAESESEHKDAIEQVATAAAVSGAAAVAGAGASIKAYADFDKQMSVVDSATHETAENMDRLRQAAIDAGADTAFSAGEAARGIEELAKAGVSTDDILAGGLNGSLALAAAGSLDVGTAAEIAASALTQFKLSGDKVPHVADLLAAGAGKAQGSVEDLGAALNQSGLVAASTGLTIEETTGALSAFASAGLTGSDAGTSFKTMLMSLNPNSKEAAKLMEDLGIKAYDSQGKFIGMSEYAGVLQNSLKSMSDEQRNATLKTLFGSDAVRAANILYQEGADGINKWESAVNDAGYAADTARRMQNNLAGDLEKLGGSFDTVLIQSGSGANDVLRGLVQSAGSLVDVVGQIPGPVLSVGVGLVGVTGGALVLGSGLVALNAKIATTRAALALLAPAGTRAGTALAVAGKAAAGATSALVAVAVAATVAKPAIDNILAPTGATGDALEKFAGQAAQGAVGADTLSLSFQDLVQHKDGVSDFQAAIEGIADPGLWGNIDNVLTDTVGIVTLGMVKMNSTSETARERFKAMGAQLASLDADKAAASFQSMAKNTDGSGESLKRLLDYMPDYRKKLEEQAKASGLATDDQTLLDIAMGKVKTSTEAAATATDIYTDAAGNSKPVTEDMAKALEEIGVNAAGAVVDLDKFTQALLNAGVLQLSARDASRGWSQALLDMGLNADGTGGKIGVLGTAFDNTTAQGIKNQAMFDGVAQAGIRNAEAMAKAGASNEELQGNLSQTYNGLIAAAGQFGITGGEAEALARKVLGVPDGVNIDSWMSDQAKKMAEGTKAAADAIDGRVITIRTRNITQYEEIMGPSGKSASLFEAQNGGATGGRVSDLAGLAGGGRVPGGAPADMSRDNVLALVDGKPFGLQSDEWVINGRSSNKYDRELAAINAGTFPKLPGFANGGREYAAQSFGHASTAPAVPASFEGNLFLDSGEFLGKVRGVASQVTDGAIAAADSQSQYRRRGR